MKIIYFYKEKLPSLVYLQLRFKSSYFGCQDSGSFWIKMWRFLYKGWRDCSGSLLDSRRTGIQQSRFPFWLAPNSMKLSSFVCSNWWSSNISGSNTPFRAQQYNECFNKSSRTCISVPSCSKFTPSSCLKMCQSYTLDRSDSGISWMKEVNRNNNCLI